MQRRAAHGPAPVTGAGARRPGSPAGPSEVVRARLATVPAEPRSWLAAGVITLIAAVLRLLGLSHPPGKIFDEVYYATEGEEMLRYGVEWRPETAAGDYVVHPPLGKWCIALGIKLFGPDGVIQDGTVEFGWRIMPAIAGIITVLLVTRIARRLFRSTVLGCAAGLLVTLDGLHFVLSRSALLDIFLTMFVVAAFGCLLLDRDQIRAAWLRALETGLAPTEVTRKYLPVRWWRLAAAVLMGCAGSVKWSAAFLVIPFLILMIVWEMGLRRTLDLPGLRLLTFAEGIAWSLVMGAIAFGVYLASWWGWFTTDYGWNRHGLLTSGKSEPPVLGALINLWDYHRQMLDFHEGLSEPHRYQSWPWQWLLMGRPVAFYWSDAPGCGAERCAAEVLLLGTPLLWWSFLPALAALVWFGIARRDWRALAIGLPVVGGFLPWFWYALDKRTMYVFYALPAEPFLVFAVVYVLGAIIGTLPAGAPVRSDRRLVGTIAAGAYIVVIAACFAYFYPIFVGEQTTYEEWWARMWLGTRWV